MLESGIGSGAGDASVFLALLVLEAGVRFAAGDSPAVLVADFLAGGVFLAVAGLEEESAFRVLMMMYLNQSLLIY